jgi:hypothetical protein
MRIPIIFIFSVESQSFFVTVFWIAVTVRCHISDGDRPDECWHDRLDIANQFSRFTARMRRGSPLVLSLTL